jgi:hypothetical protein
MDLFSRLGEGKRDGIFNFRESEKPLKKTPRGSFFWKFSPSRPKKK